MGAQRKLADPAPTAPLDDATPVDRAPPADYQSPRTADGALPNSPAILLQEQLAARLTGADLEAQNTPAAEKWPMPARIVTIVGLSLGLWGGIVAAAVAYYNLIG